MTTDQKNLVQESFTQVTPIAEVAAKLFYDRATAMKSGAMEQAA